jgi:hypothetical protein
MSACGKSRACQIALICQRCRACLIHCTCAPVELRGEKYFKEKINLPGQWDIDVGNDRGNLIAMVVGFTVVTILSDLANTIARLFGKVAYVKPDWLPTMEFPWWICFGTIVTFLVAVLFRTEGGSR